MAKKAEEPLYGTNQDGSDDALDGAPPFVVRPFTSESAAAAMFSFAPPPQTDDGSMSSEGVDFADSDGGAVVHTRAATTSSIASAITETSAPPVFVGSGAGYGGHVVGSSGGQWGSSGSSSSSGVNMGGDGSTGGHLPFPFPNRPALPHVDDFVPKSKLQYDHLRMMSGYEKKAAFAKKGVNFPSDLPHTQHPQHAQHEQHPHMWHVKSGSVTAPGSAATGLGSPSYGHLSTLTERQVYLFIDYIQFFGEVDARSSHYRGITYADIETALRQHTRTTIALQEGTDDPTELLMAAFDDLLQRSKLTPTTWFQRNSMQKAGNEPKLTKELFCQSIRGMCREHFLPAWTNLDMRQLRLHLSVDGQTEPTMGGVLRAFRRYHALGEEKTIMDAAHPVVAKIKKLMRRRKIRIVDFFNYIQADPLKPMSARTLAHAIDQVLGTGGSVPVHSPRRRTPQTAALPIQEPSALSMLSNPALPHRSNTLTLSKLHAQKSSLLLSSISGKIPGKKTGSDAIKIDPLPAAIEDFLDDRFVHGQRSLYSNGSVYANSEGRKKIANVITTLRTRRSIQSALEATAAPTLYVAPSLPLYFSPDIDCHSQSALPLSVVGSVGPERRPWPASNPCHAPAPSPRRAPQGPPKTVPPRPSRRSPRPRRLRPRPHWPVPSLARRRGPPCRSPNTSSK